ncbi:DUF4189 domain-containing protein [Paracidovorax wautersii]|uniref:DUF4189 domain-containing protein n=1 Tax=Paracidovorax wautersii TaxID=1177982 RepID=A0ABU1IDD4_9BURK|nr:DUF4189 domain-containing protein [Paracidovorax wautersii]MDR6214583.1 hypothetical protein [Paracidovorax wautersii]
MNRINSFSVLFVLCYLSMGVRAEGNCPAGYYPIGGGTTAGCAPIPSNSATSGGGQQQAPSAPVPLWEDRWGAVAFDGPKGILGVATGLQSEYAAQQSALNDCKARGGIKCQSEISYKNGCTAFTIGDLGYYRGADATLSEVVIAGMQKCKEKDKNCETYYSACSPPVRIR